MNAHRITRCTLCPRLIRHCKEVAKTKRKAYENQNYWGKPVPSFGDDNPKLLIVGLAPAAHGANRTGRMFTGDRSGDWLYRALHKAGFANQPHSEHAKDGLKLFQTRITAAAHCAPPDNKPLPSELENCSRYLKAELSDALGYDGNLQAILVLGKIALDQLWPLLPRPDQLKKPVFGHGHQLKIPLPDRTLLLMLSYHPSQQNTFTKRLTEPMFDQVFTQLKLWIDHSK